MDTFGLNTGSLTIQGQNARDYLRGCLTNPGKLGDLLVHNREYEISAEGPIVLTVPNLTSLGPPDIITLFIKALYQEGFWINDDGKTTSIFFPASEMLPGFPVAKEAASMSEAAIQKLVEDNLAKVETVILQTAALGKVTVRYDALTDCPADVVKGVIAFLSSRGYSVQPQYGHVSCDYNETYVDIVAYSISWEQVREEPSFWNKFFRRTK